MVVPDCLLLTSAKIEEDANIAVLDKAWMGGGNTARNTTIIRANYLTPEGVAFYKESVELFRGLSEDLDINIMYSERGHFTLAHTDAAMRTARWRAEVNKHLGVDSEVIDADEVALFVKDGKVELTAVTPGHDFGDQIEIISGLKANDQVIVNPPDSIVAGQQVQIVQATLPGDIK